MRAEDLLKRALLVHTFDVYVYRLEAINKNFAGAQWKTLWLIGKQSLARDTPSRNHNKHEQAKPLETYKNRKNNSVLDRFKSSVSVSGAVSSSATYKQKKNSPSIMINASLVVIAAAALFCARKFTRAN